MDQPEEILEKLERFNGQKNPEIPRELDEYVSFVARTGDSVFAWSLVKNLYREKLINVITEFYNEQPTKELPTYPNVDPFNYETLKKILIERLDSFIAAPFTIQRISELLADPRKQYSRIDKFMRAVEKNILVVSTVAPGRHRSEESENGDSLDSALNGEFASEVNVDVDMDNEGSFTISKEFNATTHRKEGNHEIVTVTHETITIKKTATKEEEASTSTKIIETKSIDTEAKSDESLSTTEKIEEEEEEEVTTESKEQEALKKSETPQESTIPEVAEPKIDDTLLNEPLRPAENDGNEILVDISDISSTTTPLAALENIVAIRTDPSVIETIETARIELQPTREIPLEPAEEVAEQSEQKETTGDGDVDGDDSEEDCQSAKRLKLAEVETKIEEVPLEEVEKKEEEQPVVEHSLEKEKEHEEEAESPKTVIVQEPIEEPQKIQSEESETIAQEATTVELAEEITEPLLKEVPIVEDPIPAEPINPIVETTMSLDEDEPPAVSMEVVSTNKMDTDENEAETALMDVDDEPMDQ